MNSLLSTVLLNLVVPPVVGGIVAAMVMVGVVQSQTQTPEANPANQSAITYGK